MFNDQDKKAVEGLIGFRDFDYSSNPIPRTDQFSTFFMTEFSERLPANLTPEIRAIMAEAFPGAPLLDMGCGFYPREPVLPLAVEFGSSAYLGIDITHSDHNIKNSPIPAYHINCDMLQFILVVGGNRANFVFNGITDFIDSE
ncbi:hypothetical protein KY362_07420, partial [Candidatus Woesearchaeota archaeon]|nr:hypothetical protein [Candidatus Woesearchaeota archaeon]